MRPNGLLKTPEVSFPTILLAAGVLVGFFGAWALVTTGAISLLAGSLLSTVALYAAFTPMHDAAHQAVARSRWVNALVGRLMGAVLTGPFPAFRFMHLTHHKNANVEGEDPDLYAGLGPRWMLPLRWLTQDLHYYSRLLRPSVWRARPLSERLEVIATVGAVVVAIAWLTQAGYLAEVIALWLIPARLAIAALAFAFDFVPHWPYEANVRQDRYRATRILASRALTPLMLGQNYHLVHHLYPGVPWYRYGTVFWALEDELRAKGARIDFAPSRPRPPEMVPAR